MLELELQQGVPQKKKTNKQTNKKNPTVINELHVKVTSTTK